MNTSQVNRRIQKFLRDLADEGTFHIRKGRGHLSLVGTYGGEQRTFCLCISPGGNYQVYQAGNVNRFVKSLSINHKPRFTNSKGGKSNE